MDKDAMFRNAVEWIAMNEGRIADTMDLERVSVMPTVRMMAALLDVSPWDIAADVIDLRMEFNEFNSEAEGA